MAIPLSPELQHALHASPNELEVVDPSTNQRYVIVAKNRLNRATVGQQSPQDRGRPERESEVADPWTDDKNRRRADLVDRQIAGNVTDEERAELEFLQQQMRAYREKVAPLPIEDARRLHAELMEKARQAQAGKA